MIATRRHLDYYPTETAVTNQLLAVCPDISGVVGEVTAGNGGMARTLEQHPAVRLVVTNDIDPAHCCQFTGDATNPHALIWQCAFNWVVTNPPFNAAPDILPIALDKSLVGVAFLLRLTYLEPAGNRGDWLAAHADQMSQMIVLGQPRPSFTGNGRHDSVTTAWMVWRKDWSWARLGVRPPFAFAMGWK